MNVENHPQSKYVIVERGTFRLIESREPTQILYFFAIILYFEFYICRYTLSIMSRSSIVDTSEVGNLMVWSKKETISTIFHDCENIPKHTYLTSSTLRCHGYEWKLQLLVTETHVLLYLYFVSSVEGAIGYDNNVRTSFDFRMGTELETTSLGGVKNNIMFRTGTKIFGPGANKCWKLPDLLTRNRVLENFLDRHGSLRIDIALQVYKPATRYSEIIWTPPPNLGDEMLELLESGKHADIVFNVNGTRFPAHSNIVKLRAHAFEELLEGTHQNTGNTRGNDEVPINGVEAAHFRLLLQFLYSDKINFDLAVCGGHDDEHYLRSILQVANRFGCIRLKLLAEGAIMKVGVHPGNAAELLLFADSHCCALLREEAMEVFVAHPIWVMASPGWTQLSKSTILMAELMQLAFARDDIATHHLLQDDHHYHLRNKEKKLFVQNDSASFENRNDHDTTNTLVCDMGVNEMRKILYAKGLNVDGTREMLAARMEGTCLIRGCDTFS